MSSKVQGYHLRIGVTVPGDVDERLAAVVIADARPTAIEVVDHPEDRFLIAWDDACRNYHLISGFNCDATVVVHRHARVGFHGFALAAREDQRHLVPRKFIDILWRDEQTFRVVQLAQAERDLGILKHAASHSFRTRPSRRAGWL
jgi:hypothetical protein